MKVTPARVSATAASVRTACCRFARACAAAGKWARAARLSRCKRVARTHFPWEWVVEDCSAENRFRPIGADNHSLGAVPFTGYDGLGGDGPAPHQRQQRTAERGH